MSNPFSNFPIKQIQDRICDLLREGKEESAQEHAAEWGLVLTVIENDGEKTRIKLSQTTDEFIDLDEEMERMGKESLREKIIDSLYWEELFMLGSVLTGMGSGFLAGPAVGVLSFGCCLMALSVLLFSQEGRDN